MIIIDFIPSSVVCKLCVVLTNYACILSVGGGWFSLASNIADNSTVKVYVYTNWLCVIGTVCPESD